MISFHKNWINAIIHIQNSNFPNLSNHLKYKL